MKEVNFRKIVLSLFFVFAFGLVGCNKERQGLVSEDEINGTNKKVVGGNYGNITESEKFVVEVDPDVNNWQTKEVEFFTIKFPKEWYWLESDREKTGYYSQVITNNSEFAINDYSEIGFGAGREYPLVFVDDNEIIISFHGASTSDAGTPQDSLDSLLESFEEKQDKCTVVNNETIPFISRCSVVYGSHSEKVYGVIGNKTSLVVSVRTPKNSSIEEEVVEGIIESIILKK